MIEARGLTKFYGDFPAIEDVSFAAEPGEVIGFLGPNGAGKTTTMRIITGFTPPTAGTAVVAGHDVQEEPLEARASIGYLPETVPLYTDMTVREYLHYMGELRGMRKSHIRSRVDDVFGLCRLEEYTDSLVSKLSKGYRQRVGIAQAILHEPPVLVLDEPTIGIDPRQVVETRQIIRGLGGDHTVILSTHILPEVSMVCDRVLIIHEGRIVVMDTAERLSARLGGVSRVVMDVRGPRDQIQQALSQVDGVVEVQLSDAGGRQQFVVECAPGRDIRIELARAMADRGWGLVELRAMGLSLEEIFLRLTTEDEETAA
ncbi:MAG: ATP-binding cassette domain-containing protein [Chloroflexi bacterium]|nr:ATP-binding cassette domain-containing protein [Chloroflexota bacterium]